VAEQGVINAGIQPLKMLDLEDMEISGGLCSGLNYGTDEISLTTSFVIDFRGRYSATGVRPFDRRVEIRAPAGRKPLEM